MLRLLCVFLSFFFLIAARGQMRTDAELKETAAVFFANRASQQDGTSASKAYRPEDISIALQKRNLAVATGDNRFVVLAKDKDMEPVLGFSESAYIESNMPPALTAWIEKTDSLLYDKACSSMFALPDKQIPQSVPGYVEPLLSTAWSQWDPYNAMVPHYIKSSDDQETYAVDKGSYAEMPTGCIATSMGQIMKYYRYPSRGRNSHSCEVKHGNGTVSTLTMDFGKINFDWANMLDEYLYSYDFDFDTHSFSQQPDFTQVQSDAVSTLMLACGIASDMDYTPKGSAASMIAATHGFTQFFDYDAHYVNDAAALQKVMYKYLATDIPLIVSGPGHAFIIDGYDNKGYLHANFGWEGDGDGYYLFPNMDKYEIEDFILARPANKIPTPVQLSAGTLGSALSTMDNDKLFALKITGNLGASDFFALKNKGQQTIIETIDLGEATSNSNDFTSETLNGVLYFNISLPRNIRSISKGAFSSNASLSKITIPSTVLSIGEEAFRNCKMLYSINFPGSISEIGKNAFLSCKGLTTLTLPEGLKHLGFAAFEHCSNITELVIPASLEEMEAYCFDGCNGLKTVTYLSRSPRGVASTAFYDYYGTNQHAIYDQATLRVPHGCKDKVKNLEGWREFNNIVELPAADTNNDATVNTADVVSVYTFIEKGPSFGITKDMADVNGDNNINTADIVAIYSYIVEGNQ